MTEQSETRTLSALPFYGVLYGPYTLTAWAMVVAIGAIATLDDWPGFSMVWILQVTGVALAMGVSWRLLEWTDEVMHNVE